MKKIMTRVAVLFFAMMSLLQLPASAAVADRIVAVVGNEIILKSEIDNRELMTKMQFPELAKEKGLGRSILEGVIDQKIILAKAKIDSVSVDENAVNGMTNDRFKQLSSRFSSAKEMEARFGKSSVGIREQIRLELRNQQLVETLRKKKTSGVTVSYGEVVDFYKENKEKFPEAPIEVSVSQILKYPEVSAEAKAAALASIQQVHRELQAGGDFAALARKFSQDPGSAKVGGDLGYARKGEFVPSFEAAAYALKEGKVSDIVETRYGYHLIQLLNKEQNSIHARHILILFDRSKTDFTGIVRQLDGIRSQVLDGKANFADMAKKYSDDAVTASSGGEIVIGGSSKKLFPLTALRPQLQQIIGTLKKPGEITTPQKIDPPQGEPFYAIFRLNDLAPAHRINLDTDYNRLEQLALDNKNGKLFNEWLDNLRKEVYIRISDI
ncbi:MAG: peptidylprolyl isomerase [Chlorobium sp.]|nr:MAG: peptidylprolyl isomerase [Chlorobium sp.]